ncbi:pyrimidine 5 -nucleotidase [Fusarium longipes]|uniref:Pyrimidine 5-nucleotidase n=1 Tax=Fusarium longipes TaxID=694270 RepID=A0A395SZU8_9HYPO|nr:pyrimidine 5 -nucleotidase [Fusarium longipes]
MDGNSQKPVLFFDIDNCLYSRNYKVLELMSANIDSYFKTHLGISPEEAESLHKSYYKQYGQAIEGLVHDYQIDALDYNAKVDDALPLDDLIKPNPQLRQFLEEIDTSKVRLWLLTNAYVNHGKRVIKLLGVDDLFEGLTYCDYSQVPFICKPQKEMYFKAMKEAGISEVSNCYFIDDSYKNCVGAQKAGWMAVHYVEEGFPLPETPASQHQIRNFEELLYTTASDFGNVKITGVGCHTPYELNEVVSFPRDPSKRYDDDNFDDDNLSLDSEVESSYIDVLGPMDFFDLSQHGRDEFAWGFHFHDACWGVFSLNFDVKLDLLFHLLLSTPQRDNGLLCWGHSYGGAASRELVGDIWTWRSAVARRRNPNLPHLFSANPFHIPALEKAIKFSVPLQQDVFQSELDPRKLSLSKDLFCSFPPEILQNILTLLPSSNVLSLRLVSPVFATLGLSERFWASRFEPGKEYEYLPDVFVRPPISWRAFCLSLHIWAPDCIAMHNRKRVWKLTQPIRSLLRQMQETECHGIPSHSWFETGAPDDLSQVKGNMCWYSAQRYVESEDADRLQFVSGCRPMRYRSVRAADRMRMTQVAVHLVNTPTGTFVSGMSFINRDGAFTNIGYLHPGKMVCIALSSEQYIQGWELALDTSGVRAIAVVAQDGAVSSFAGNPDGIPRKRLAVSEGISSIIAAFDAVKLVSLSCRGTGSVQEWRTKFLWLPEVPSRNLLFDGARTDLQPENPNIPVQTVMFGTHEVNGRTLTGLNDILCSNYDICHVVTMDFIFTGERRVSLGHMDIYGYGQPPPRYHATGGQPGVRGFSMEIDGGDGEEISGLEVQIDGECVVGLKIQTNRIINGNQRSELLTSPNSPVFNNPWIQVRPKGSRVVGLYAVCGGYGSFFFRDIGLISQN